MDPEIVVAAPVSEEVADAATEQAEVVSDAAVQIAEIEADARVEIAASDNAAMVEVAQIRADETEDDLLWLRDQLGALQASHVSLEARMEAMASMMLTMQGQHELMLSSLEKLSILIPPLTPAEPEIVAEAETPDSSVVVVAPEEPATPRRRWM